MRHLLHAIACWLALVLFAHPAGANDVADCWGPIANDRRIEACSRIIGRGGDSGLGLAYAYAFRGSGHAAKSDRDRAIADYDSALKIAASEADRHFFRGLAQTARRQFDAAVISHGEAIKLEPTQSRFYNGRGNALLGKGDRQRAIADYTEAIRLAPRDAFPLNNRGRTYEALGDHEHALADFDAAVHLEPRWPQAYSTRCLFHRERGDFDRAFVDCEEALRLDPSFPQAFNARALVYLERRDPVHAMADLEAAIRLDPRYAFAYNNRGIIHRNAKRLDAAIADFDTAISIDPVPLQFYGNRALALALKGDKARAIADLNRVVETPAATPSDRHRQEIARERLKRLTRGTSAGIAPSLHKRVALVIGNGAYANAPLLPNPPNDAHAVAASLKRLGFTLVLELRDANREQIGQALKDFGDAAEKAEWAVVFFAGHGIEVNGTTFLVPVDAKLVRDTHVEDEAVSLTRVVTKVDGASKLGLVILDSCRNNPFVGRMLRSVATRAVRGGLAPIEPEGNVLVAYAAKHGTVAEDGDGANSPFTSSLLAHIDEKDLEVTFLFRKVRDDVRAATAKRQEPFLYGSLGSELLYFNPAQR